MEKYITIRDLKEYLAVNEATLYRLIRDGLPSMKIGGSRRFKVSEVEEWIRAQNESKKSDNENN